MTAQEKPDGTVVVTWPAAHGQGNKVVRYDVTAISTGQQIPAGSSTTTSFTVPAGKLTYGTQVAFTVAAVNDKGAASQPSPVSNTVLPYTVPEKPTVTVATATDAKGTLNVSWTAPAENGRPITKYVVTAGTVTQEVTSGRSTKVSGLANGASVTVTVKAVNEAGAGLAGSANAKTIEGPTVSAVSATSTETSITVKFTTTNGGASTLTCSVTVSGKAAVTGACGSITVGSLLPGTSYSYTVAVTNPVETANAAGTQSTVTVTGSAYCEPPAGTTDSASLTWCDTGKNALELQTSPATLYVGQIGRTTSKTSYPAYCYTTGDQVYAYKYNNDKDTNIWIKIGAQGGQYYTPLAWFNVNDNNAVTTGALPHC